MTNEKDNIELEQLWQSIEAETDISANELEKIAKKSKLKNKLILIWDLLGCLICIWVLYLAIMKDSSFVVIGWLVLAIVFAFWLTWKFNRYRRTGEKALSNSTASYQNYLIEKANSDIKIGKLFNRSNTIMLVSMSLVLGYEYFFSSDPIISDVSTWIFIVAWTTFWGGLLFAYGYWKIRKGKKALKQLQ